MGCTRGVGGPVPGAPAHHREHGFANANPDFARPPFWTRTSFFVRRMWAATFSPRRIELPRVANDGAALRENQGEPTVTWIGHATLLIQLAGVNILTDPQWSERASPLSFAGPPRVTPPGLRFEDLPPIHVVLISHDHYDHLDEATVRRLAEAHHPRFYVPLGLRAWFADLGITDVVELDWWDSRPERGLTLTCVPVQHWTARSWFEMNRRLWSGWVVAGGDRRLFFGGDTGYYAPYFKAIGERMGPFDLAAISIGKTLFSVVLAPHNPIIQYHNSEMVNIFVTTNGTVETVDSRTDADATALTAFLVVMEYADGGWLNRTYREEVIVQKRDDYHYLDDFIDVCVGLRAAHAENVIHRDVKPQNLMWFRKSNKVKIGDFGIAKHLAGAGIDLAADEERDQDLGVVREVVPTAGQVVLVAAVGVAGRVGVVLEQVDVSGDALFAQPPVGVDEQALQDPLAGLVVRDQVDQAVALRRRVLRMTADIQVQPGAVAQEHVAAAPPGHHPAEQVPGHLIRR
jgi:L-ascorbate metabolism protein UlaG (beta-lactamase superfamily)